MGALLVAYVILEWSWVAFPSMREVALFGVALLFTGFRVWGGLKLSEKKEDTKEPNQLSMNHAIEKARQLGLIESK